MLHDPRHDKTPTLAGFGLFVASREANERYIWTSSCECAVGQYLASIGRDIPLDLWKGELETMNTLAHGPHSIDYIDAHPDRWTFGELADRILEHQRSSRDSRVSRVSRGPAPSRELVAA